MILRCYPNVSVRDIPNLFQQSLYFPLLIHIYLYIYFIDTANIIVDNTGEMSP